MLSRSFKKYGETPLSIAGQDSSSGLVSMDLVWSSAVLSREQPLVEERDCVDSADIFTVTDGSNDVGLERDRIEILHGDFVEATYICHSLWKTYVQ